MRAPREAYRDRIFLVSRPYICESCRWVFVGPCNLTLCAVAIAVGVVLLLAAGGLGGFETLSDLRLLGAGAGWRQVPSLLWNAITAIGGMWIGAWIVYVGAGTAIISLRWRREQKTHEIRGGRLPPV